ncbi:MAG: GNAT family N-acetyltransferase [Pseudomonadota bacterium]
MRIIQATMQHVADVARLFDLYRQFYECEADIDLASDFIFQRITKKESVIFIAMDGVDVVGFTQLYPSFCSVDAIKIFILYDLFVDESGRNKGVGRQLMQTAHAYAKDEGAQRVDLLTAHSNKPGQHLYEKLGYKKVNEDFYAYSLSI